MLMMRKYILLSSALLLLAASLADARPRQLSFSKSDHEVPSSSSLRQLRRELGKKSKSEKTKQSRATDDKDDDGDDDCVQTKLVRLYEDLNNPDYVQTNNQAVGSQDYVNVPIYDLADDDTAGDQIGMYQGVLTYVPGGDCVGSYMWSFDYDQGSGTYRTQFYTPLTCLGLTNPVTGSVGDVVGATGELSLCGNVLNDEKDETIGDILCLVTCSSDL